MNIREEVNRIAQELVNFSRNHGEDLGFVVILMKETEDLENVEMCRNISLETTRKLLKTIGEEPCYDEGYSIPPRDVC